MPVAEVILTAGIGSGGPAKQIDPRKEAISAARKVLRDPAATDDQVDDALEALVELAKE